MIRKIEYKNKPKFVKLQDSKTRSLEKNPTSLGKPIKFNKETYIIKQENGVYKDPEDRNRISWLWAKLIIISPIVIKRRDLNKAWLNRWKKERLKRPKEKDIPMKPKCLRVERAISFFKSFSKTVLKPA